MAIVYEEIKILPGEGKAFAIFSISINAGVNHSKVISQDVALKLSDYGFFTNLSKQRL